MTEPRTPWRFPIPRYRYWAIFDRPLQATARRLKILKECEWVNCEGGIGYGNPDLKWLRQKGLIKIVRYDQGTTYAGNPRTFSKIVRTAAGEKALEKGRL